MIYLSHESQTCHDERKDTIKNSNICIIA